MYVSEGAAENHQEFKPAKTNIRQCPRHILFCKIKIRQRLTQSHYREVAYWEISMKKKNGDLGLFGPVGNTEKKIGPIMSNF